MNMFCRTGAAACLTLALASPSFAGQVKLEIRDGLVTLDAKDATLREILNEWSRVGQTRVVNAERVPSAPMTLQLNGVSEASALETLLRSTAGYIAAPRQVALATGSIYDRILLMPGTRPAASAATAAGIPTRTAQPAWGRPQQQQLPNPATDDQDEPIAQQPQFVPAATPSPTGAPTPGMMTAPAQPTPGTMTTPAPYNPATPYGTPLGPNMGNQPTPGVGVPIPQPQARPGMPTTPPKPPGQPGGEGGQGQTER